MIYIIRKKILSLRQQIRKLDTKVTCHAAVKLVQSLITLRINQHDIGLNNQMIRLDLTMSSNMMMPKLILEVGPQNRPYQLQK